MNTLANGVTRKVHAILCTKRCNPSKRKYCFPFFFLKIKRYYRNLKNLECFPGNTSKIRGVLSKFQERTKKK